MNIKDLIIETTGNKSARMKLILNKDFVFELKEKTKFMDQQNPRSTHRIYAVVNDIYEIPKCPVCGCNRKLDMTDHHKGWREFCGDACSKRSGKRTSHAREKLESKEWLEEQRVTLKRSIESIADGLGVSTQPVLDSLDKFGICGIDSRKRNSLASLCLESKETMEMLYCTEGLTMEEIAIRLGSSKATVQRWIHEHGIEARDPNSYDRRCVSISYPQWALYTFISQYFPDAVMNDRSTLSGIEMDIYIPSKKFAIEYNGFPHHFYGWNDKTGKYHLNKTEVAKSAGIFLMHIFPSDLYDKTEILESLIKQKLGVTERRIYARNCEIAEIPHEKKNEFLLQNHIQGEDRARVRLGLYNGDELVSVMTFARGRFNKGYKWELSRFACKKNTTVVGGFSKLLKHFMKENKEPIISYADRRYSDGGVYEKNGFKLLHINPPSYYYVSKNSNKLNHRMLFQLKSISTPGDTRTEKEIMESLGYNRVYDSGTLAYGIS